MTWLTGNFDAMLSKMAAVNSKSISVGVAKPKSHTRSNRRAISAAQIYQWMEEGTRDGHVPKRPTLKPTFAKYRPLLIPFASNIMQNAAGKGDYNKSLDGVGKTYTTLVKKAIMDLQYPPIRPITVATRVNAGTSNPLIDTSQLYNSIGYVVR